MSEGSCPAAITIRPAVPEDAEGVTRTYLESAEHHAAIDPERYAVPAAEAIVARYRDGRQHPEHTHEECTTLVAELGDEIVGFVDSRLERPYDAMHREMTYCYVSEIAVSHRHRSQGIGGRLLRAAEDWGRGRGADLAVLEYNPANTRAAEFYQRRMGYRVASITVIRPL